MHIFVDGGSLPSLSLCTIPLDELICLCGLQPVGIWLASSLWPL